MTPSRHHSSIVWAWGTHGFLLFICGGAGLFMGLIDPAMIHEFYGDSWLATMCLTTIDVLDQAAWTLLITAIATIAATIGYLKPTAGGRLFLSIIIIAQAIGIVPASWWLHHAIGLEGIGKWISVGSEIGSALMIIGGAALSLWAMWRPQPASSDTPSEVTVTLD